MLKLIIYKQLFQPIYIYNNITFYTNTNSAKMALHII